MAEKDTAEPVVIDQPWDEITARYWAKIQSGEMTIKEVYDDYRTMEELSKTTLLGGPGHTPATVEEKREFADLCKKWPAVTSEELDRMQRIEWSLTLEEYQLLKFGSKKVEAP